MKSINYLSKKAKKNVPYQWEESAGNKALRFDTNTVPFPPPDLQRFFKSLGNGCPINEYKDPSYKRLEALIAQYENVNPDMIAVTNSGDEAIDVLAKTFLDAGDVFLVTPPTYEIFSIQCELNMGRVVEDPLISRMFNVNTANVISKAKKKNAKIIFLCNPNNPTGTIISQEEIEKIVRNCSCIVVVDEAYREFYGKSSVSLLQKYDNLVILRSFSKFAGIAGARVGYLIAGPSLTSKFRSIRFPMGVSYFSYKLAEWVLENDQKWMKDQVEIIKKERTKVARELSRLGYFVYASQANFLLVKIGSNAKELCSKLREKGILVKDRSSKKYIEGCIRITIRSPKENMQLINAFEDIALKKYALIDRDGTLIFEPQDTFQVESIKKLKVLNGAISGLKELIKQGYKLILITNQDGLGTATFPKKDFEGPQNKMLQIFKENGITFTKIYICPHSPSDNCECRKPKTGLIKNFLKVNKMDKKKSFVCGDRLTDNLLATNIGIKFIPVKTNRNFYNALKKGGVI